MKESIDTPTIVTRKVHIALLPELSGNTYVTSVTPTGNRDPLIRFAVGDV